MRSYAKTTVLFSQWEAFRMPYFARSRPSRNWEGEAITAGRNQGTVHTYLLRSSKTSRLTTIATCFLQ